MPRPKKSAQRPLPKSSKGWLEEIADAYADALGVNAFAPITETVVGNEDLFHLAPSVCLKFRGMKLGGSKLETATEAALTSYVATKDSASWKRTFPDQAQYVVGDLSPAKGTEAVLNMSQILGRLMAMESGAEREATRQQDTAALALLAQRGIGPAERTEAAALVEQAMSTPSGAPRTPEEIAAADEAYVRALGELRDWYELWAEMARIEVKRRDRLIQLGLAHRQSGADEPDIPEPAWPEA